MKVNFETRLGATEQGVQAAWKYLAFLTQGSLDDLADLEIEVTVYPEIIWEVGFRLRPGKLFRPAFMTVNDVNTSMGYSEHFWIENGRLYGSENPYEPLEVKL